MPIPERELFLCDVRKAINLVSPPTVRADYNTDTKKLSLTFQRANLWLTRAIVNRYNRADFTNWSVDMQEELRAAVEVFRAIAAEVPEDGPADFAQETEGPQALHRLAAALRTGLLLEWKSDADGLVALVEQWSNKLGWRANRGRTTLEESLLGEYELPQLLIDAEQDLYVLAPVARFVTRAMGSFDLSRQPSFAVTGVYRHFDGRWRVFMHSGPDATGLKSRLLSKESFRSAVLELKSALR